MNWPQYVSEWMLMCGFVMRLPGGSLCAGSQNMRRSITSYSLWLEPHRSGLGSDKQPDPEHLHLDWEQACTPKHLHTASTLAEFQAKASQERKLPHAHIPGIFIENHSFTQCGPCAVNIQGGRIFPRWVAFDLYASFTVHHLLCPHPRKQTLSVRASSYHHNFELTLECQIVFLPVWVHAFHLLMLCIVPVSSWWCAEGLRLRGERPNGRGYEMCTIHRMIKSELMPLCVWFHHCVCLWVCVLGLAKEIISSRCAARVSECYPGIVWWSRAVYFVVQPVENQSPEHV